MQQGGQRFIEMDFPIQAVAKACAREAGHKVGNISQLHQWFGRRPLAACRAVLLATLLPAPKTASERSRLEALIGGETEHIPESYRRLTNERPRLLDPMAGGGSIPLAALGLDCDVVANDLNPVAYLILLATLRDPLRLGDQTRPLPELLKGLQMPKPGGKGFSAENISLNYAGHFFSWGHWILSESAQTLAPFYGMGGGSHGSQSEKQPQAFLWASTLSCPQCRTTIPLIKNGWLDRTSSQTVMLSMSSNAERTAVTFELKTGIAAGASVQERFEKSRSIARGNLGPDEAVCPCCDGRISRSEIQRQGLAGELGQVMTVLVMPRDGDHRYKIATPNDNHRAMQTESQLAQIGDELPWGLPSEEIAEDTGNTWCRLYGKSRFRDLFLSRQLLALGTFVKNTRRASRFLTTIPYSTLTR